MNWGIPQLEQKQAKNDGVAKRILSLKRSSRYTDAGSSYDVDLLRMECTVLRKVHY